MAISGTSVIPEGLARPSPCQPQVVSGYRKAPLRGLVAFKRIGFCVVQDGQPARSRCDVCPVVPRWPPLNRGLEQRASPILGESARSIFIRDASCSGFPIGQNNPLGTASKAAGSADSQAPCGRSDANGVGRAAWQTAVLRREIRRWRPPIGRVGIFGRGLGYRLRSARIDRSAFARNLTPNTQLEAVRLVRLTL